MNALMADIPMFNTVEIVIRVAQNLWIYIKHSILSVIIDLMVRIITVRP